MLRLATASSNVSDTCAGPIALSLCYMACYRYSNCRPLSHRSHVLTAIRDGFLTGVLRSCDDAPRGRYRAGHDNRGDEHEVAKVYRHVSARIANRVMRHATRASDNDVHPMPLIPVN